MSKEVQTHVVVTAQAYGAFRHGQVIPVEQLPSGDYWKNYLGDGLRYASEAEVGSDFVTVTRNKHEPGSAETELAEARKSLREKQKRIDQLEIDASRSRNDKAQTESPSLLAGKDKEIKELKVALADAQQKLAKSQAENIGLKQQLEAAGSGGSSTATGNQAEPGGEQSPAGGDGQADNKPANKSGKKAS